MTLSKEVFEIVTNASLLSVFIPLIIGIFRVRALNLQLGALFAFIIVSAGADYLNYRFAMKNEQNYVVFNTYTILESLLLSFIYFTAFSSKRVKRFIIAAILLLLLLTFYFFLVKNKFDQPDNIISTIESGLFIFLAYAFYNKLLIELNVQDLYSYPFFWINSAFLLYFSGAFFLFLYNVELAKMDKPHYRFLYSFLLYLHIISNLMLGAAQWKIRPKQPG